MNYTTSSLFHIIQSFYNRNSMTPNDKIDLETLEHDINTLNGVEIDDFVKRIHEMIIEIKLNQLSEYFNRFKLYFKDYIKFDISKLNMIICNNEINDTESVKLLKVIIDQYSELINDINIDRIKSFAHFLNITIDETEIEYYLKFIRYGNMNGGWRQYNYSLIDLKSMI
jgi:hypothetical protein